MVFGEACGKVILFGEHFVVHGVPAIAAGISNKAIVEVEPANEMVFDPGNQRTIPELTYKSIRNVLSAMGIKGNFKVILKGDLATSGGLGSSAAFCVALVIAFAKHAGLSLTKEQINAFAYEGEKAFHGNPSGIDNVMATYGGIMKYTRGNRAEQNRFEPLRTAESFYLAVGVTGKSSPTVEMVSKVGDFKKEKPKEFTGLAEKAGRIVSDAEAALSSGNLSELGKLMNENEVLLEALGVVSAENLKIINSVRNAGALGAKITGGGGGGCCIALAKDKAHAEKILAAIRKDGFEGFVTIVS